MNTDLLLQLADAIEADPAAYDQRTYGQGRPSRFIEPVVCGRRRVEVRRAFNHYPCRTPCCVVGHTLRLAGALGPGRGRPGPGRRPVAIDRVLRVPQSKLFALYAEGLAGAALGLTEAEYEYLFDTIWPVRWVAPPQRAAWGLTDTPVLFTPTAPQAAYVLRRIARGAIDLAGAPTPEEQAAERATKADLVGRRVQQTVQSDAGRALIGTMVRSHLSEESVFDRLIAPPE